MKSQEEYETLVAGYNSGKWLEVYLKNYNSYPTTICYTFEDYRIVFKITRVGVYTLVKKGGCRVEFPDICKLWVDTALWGFGVKDNFKIEE